VSQSSDLDSAQVCIVGAGAAGGIMAAELGRRGIQVAVLESGPRHDFDRRAEYTRRFVKGENPWQTLLPGLDAHTTGGSVPFSLVWRRARGVGGSTLHWEGYAIRFHAGDFRLRTLHGVAEDWPIGYEHLEPYYARAESALGVAGLPDDPWASPRSTPFPLPPFPFSYTDGLFAGACQTVGVRLHHLSQARNSVAYGGRSACLACGTCHVCPTGAKASIDLTHIPPAEATGRVRLVTDATVVRLETEGDEVRSAVYVGLCLRLLSRAACKAVIFTRAEGAWGMGDSLRMAFMLTTLSLMGARSPASRAAARQRPLSLLLELKRESRRVSTIGLTRGSTYRRRPAALATL
jgi:choline dehydrogenase-like flavoprotein